MTGHWNKLGQLYVPNPQGRHPKLLTHAANPLPVLLYDNVYRIFFNGRDSRQRSSIGAVDIDLLSRNVVAEHHKPFFSHGPPGSFYADGVSIGNCYYAGSFQYMLFMGWQTSLPSRWRGAIGRLLVKTDLTLTLDSNIPMIKPDAIDPISLSYPWVERFNSDSYRMWYGSTQSWNAGNGEMLHVIKCAHSSDGHAWDRRGLAIPYSIGVAQAFSRPTVAKNGGGGYEMWFSYRSGPRTGYRIGYARSVDGMTWELDLEAAGIEISDSGWDSEMIEYPFVFDHHGQRYMLYNGNGYGKTGFGLAILSKSAPCLD